jgi:hypothetical protein
MEAQMKSKNSCYERKLHLRVKLAGKVMAAYIVNAEFGAQLQRLFDPDKKIANAGQANEGPMNYLARLAFAQADAMIEEMQRPSKPI